MKTQDCEDHWEESHEKSDGNSKQKEFLSSVQSKVEKQISITPVFVKHFIKFADEKSHCSSSNYRSDLRKRILLRLTPAIAKPTEL